MAHPRDGQNHRPEWWNGVSLGNIITIGGGIIVAAVAWGANESMQGEQDRRIDRLERVVESMAEKAEQVAIDQAAIKANIEMLVRAEGLRPVEGGK